MTTHYLQYTAKDFATDDAFIAWALKATDDAAWQTWLQQYPEKRPVVEEAKMLVMAFHQSGSEDVSAVQIDKMWKVIQQSLSTTQQPKVISLATRLKPLLRIAAVLLIMVGVGAVSYKIYQRNQTITYATTYGEMKSISLPDGSAVLLNANSQLSFRKGWENNADREVKLNGEAYFTVQHLKNNKPFVVQVSDAINIRVLGTEFNVINRHDDVKVLLNKGRIQLEQSLAGNTNTMVMKPGEIAEETKDKKLEKHTVATNNTSQVLAWKERKINFENADWATVQNWLLDNHNIILTIEDDTIQPIRFNGEFPADNWKILIAALETTYNQTAVYNGNEVTLKTRK